MSSLSPENVGAATGGRWVQAPAGPGFSGVGIDTRGDLTDRVFVAIRGARFDGHEFLQHAIASGARAIVVHSPIRPDLVPPGVGVLLVDDTRAALCRLASWYRTTLRSTTVVAITGSVGKTTVKQLVDAVLSAALRGRAAPRSFNNEIGVPLTILSADPGDEYLVVEIGANRPGEIEALGAIARPDLAVITSIGRAHLEGFGSLENVAWEKAVLLRHVPPRGVAIVNADAPCLRRHLRPEIATVLCGLVADADLRLTGRGADEGGGWMEVNGADRFRIGLPGRHNAVNALLAVAVARRLGIADRFIDEALAGASPLEMRGSRHRIGDITIYNDAYNANPDSVQASLETFVEVSARAPRRMVVLGDMLELGRDAPGLHREIGMNLLELSEEAPVDHAVLVGPLSAHTAEPLRRAWGDDRVTLLGELNEANTLKIARRLEPGDAVLLKASRAIGLERVIEALEQQSATGAYAGARFA